MLGFFSELRIIVRREAGLQEFEPPLIVHMVVFKSLHGA